MEMNVKKFKEKYLPVLILALVSFIVAAAISFTKKLPAVEGFSDIFSRFEYRIYDTLLGFSRTEKIDDSILLIDIDDESIEELGDWPWPRDEIANVVIALKELGAEYTVFDIEYLSPSAREVRDIEALQESASKQYQSALSDISYSMDILKDAYHSASSGEDEMSIDELTDTVYEQMIKPVVYDLSSGMYSAENLYKDNDEYFARALQYFGNSYMTINKADLGFDDARHLEDKNYGLERFTFDWVNDPEKKIPVSKHFSPVIKKIASGAKGAGFTNVIVDSDGKRRRNYLFGQYQDRYFAQLAMRPLLQILDVEKVEVKGNYIILRNALNTKSLKKKPERHDIKIPLDEKGRMLVTWSREPYETGINHCGVKNFIRLRRFEEDVIKALASLHYDDSELYNEDQIFILGNFNDLMSAYNDNQNQLAQMLASCQGYGLDGSTEETFSQEEFEDYVYTHQVIFQQMLQVIEVLGQYGNLPEEITNLKQYIDDYQEMYFAMAERIQGKECFFGNSSTATTDISNTPFYKEYPQLGMHANITSTILHENFIKPVKEFPAILAAFLLMLLMLFYTRQLPLAKRIIFNGIFVFALILVYCLMMVFFHIYIPVFLPFLMLFVVYLVDSILNAKNDRQFIKNTFSSYVAPKVVEEMIKNPETARLGGSMKNLTALFSDVKSFSKMSEKINDPQELLAVMNDYLGELGDVITSDDCQGTLDKFVGDEIVSFFGAPLDDEYSAYHAILAGIRMKQVDVEYNLKHKDEFLKKYNYPIVLESRVGMNYGPMVVGNIGTSKKLNYSIMGDNVNLASRLEGVNKAYGSWIMASESAWLQCDSGVNKGKIVARKLDSVRVINIERPVPIYNIVGVKDEMPQEQLDAVELFNQAIEVYMTRDFKKASSMFKKAGQLYLPDGDVCKSMIARCLENIKNGVPDDWDGVFTMKTK